jgi:hypothetical protein
MNKTDNKILFNCQEDILNNRPDHYFDVFDFIQDYYVNEAEEINNNFSHDNWKGVACWLETFYPNKIKEIPVFGRHSWRPDNFSLFFWIKHRRMGLIFLPIYYIFELFDLIRMRKDHEGVPHTSGLLLNFFIMRTFKMSLIFKLTTIRVNKYFGSWLGVFERYYNQPENVRVLNAYKGTLR